MKKVMFLAGLVSGAVLAQNWRVLAKGGIKVGYQTGRWLSETTQQAMEDLADMRAEVLEELSSQEPEA